MIGPGMPLRNGEMVELDSVPVLDVADFRDLFMRSVPARARIASLFGMAHSPLASAPRETSGAVRLVAVLANDATGSISVVSTVVKKEYPSLTPVCPQAHWFEREIHEQWRVVPVGHPWLKPIRFQPPLSETGEARPQIGCADFFAMAGEEAHEVAVGPVHAGIIEPGHFRFQCHGEDVYHLEISLGYQHRGVERSLVGGPDKQTIRLIETLAGDTTIAHAVAYAQACEALAGATSPPRSLALRGIMLELERIANHTGDLGALAGDVGFLPTMSYCGRIRGDFLNMTALLCGNRFGRSMVVPGGVRYDADAERIADLVRRVCAGRDDVTSAVELLFRTASVNARFENTGTVSRKACTDLGIVGPAARASGVGMDVRSDFPAGIYSFAHIPVATWNTGDVFGRAFVRRLEVQRSIDFLLDQAPNLPSGPTLQSSDLRLRPRSLAVALVEGWRGEVCHTAITDAAGRFAHYKVVDPSFHNWFGLALALRGQQISDFPLCNKSFNLSYCGHDL